MSSPLDWESRNIAPRQRARRWTSVSYYHWTTRVPGIDQGAVLVYGVITARCGGGTMARHLSTSDIASRLGRRRQWASERVTMLEELRLIRREPPGKGEKTPRFRVLLHPMMPGFFDSVDRGEYCLTHSQRCLRLWKEHAIALGYCDDEEDVLRRCFAIISGGQGGELLGLRLERFLTEGFEPDAEGLGWPSFQEYKTYIRFERPDVALFDAAWASHCRARNQWESPPTFESATRASLEPPDGYGDPYAGVEE